jgi:hypothetical protein
MIAFWAEATHRVYGNKGQPEEYIAKLGGRDGRMDDRQEVFNDYEMEFGNDEMEQGGGRVVSSQRVVLVYQRQIATLIWNLHSATTFEV